MTPTPNPPRCEPPPEHKDVGGWHWVNSPRWTGPDLLRWRMNSDNGEYEWMLSSGSFVSSESQTAKAWRYLAPVTPPAEVEALRAERDAALIRAQKSDAVASGAGEIGRIAVAILRAERDEAIVANDLWRQKCENMLAELTTLRATVTQLREALETAAEELNLRALQAGEVGNHDSDRIAEAIRRVWRIARAALANAKEAGE